MSKAGSKYKFYNYSRLCGNYKGESRHGLVVRKYIWSWPHTARVLVICLSSGIPNLATSKTVLCQLGIKVDYCVLFQLSLNIFLKVLFSWTLAAYEENTLQTSPDCSKRLLPCPAYFPRTILVQYIWKGWPSTRKICRGASLMGKRTLIPIETLCVSRLVPDCFSCPMACNLQLGLGVAPPVSWDWDS